MGLSQLAQLRGRLAAVGRHSLYQQNSLTVGEKLQVISTLRWNLDLVMTSADSG